MDIMEVHKAVGFEAPIWEEYKTTVQDFEGRAVPFNLVERFEFYERAKKAFAVVATGETALYANLILKKGVIGK